MFKVMVSRRFWMAAMCAPLLVACGGGGGGGAPVAVAPDTPNSPPGTSVRPMQDAEGSRLGTLAAIEEAARLPGLVGSYTQSAALNDNGLYAGRQRRMDVTRVNGGEGTLRVTLYDAENNEMITLDNRNPIQPYHDRNSSGPITPQTPGLQPYYVSELWGYDGDEQENFIFVRAYHADWTDSESNSYFGAGGYWVEYNAGDGTLVSMGAFTDGDGSNEGGFAQRGGELPLTGTATYTGLTEGPLHDSNGARIAGGTVGLTADFAAGATGTIEGTVSNMQEFTADHPGGRSLTIGITLGSANIIRTVGPTEGAFVGETRLTRNGADVSGSGGSWGGIFAGGDDRDNNPEYVGGTIGVAEPGVLGYLGRLFAWSNRRVIPPQDPPAVAPVAVPVAAPAPGGN